MSKRSNTAKMSRAKSDLGRLSGYDKNERVIEREEISRPKSGPLFLPSSSRTVASGDAVEVNGTEKVVDENERDEGDDIETANQNEMVTCVGVAEENKSNEESKKVKRKRSIKKDNEIEEEKRQKVEAIMEAIELRGEVHKLKIEDDILKSKMSNYDETMKKVTEISKDRENMAKKIEKLEVKKEKNEIIRKGEKIAFDKELNEMAKEKEKATKEKIELEQKIVQLELSIKNFERKILKMGKDLAEKEKEIEYVKKESIAMEQGFEIKRREENEKIDELILANKKRYVDYNDSQKRDLKLRCEKTLEYLEKMLRFGREEQEFSDFLRFFANYCHSKDDINFEMPKLSVEESFVLKTKLPLGWKKFRALSESLRTFSGYSILPAEKCVREFAKKRNRTAYYHFSEIEIDNRDKKAQKKGEKVEKRKVQCLEAINIKELLEERLSDLAKNNRLVYDEATKDKIWLAIQADKGGEDTKLGISIGNIRNPNSIYNFLICGIYDAGDEAEIMKQALHNVIKEVNSLTSLTYEDKIGSKITKDIEWKVSGDYKFLASSCGHSGATSTHSCIYCTVPLFKKMKVKDLKGVGKIKGEERDLKSIEKCAKDGTLSIKKDSKPLFENIEITNLIPPPLHIPMGIIQTYVVNVLTERAKVMDSGVGPKNLVKFKKETKEAKKKLKKEKGYKEVLEEEVSLIEVVLKVYEEYRVKKIISGSANAVVAKNVQNVCPSQYCIYKAKISNKIENVMSDWRKCESCDERVHIVCAGVYCEEEYEDKKMNGFFCFSCSGLSDLQSIEKHAQKYLTIAKGGLNEMDIKIENSEKEIHRLEDINKGLGSTMRKLEDAFKECGADPSVWFQTFTGNQTRQLMKSDFSKKAKEIFGVNEEWNKRMDGLDKFLKNLCEFVTKSGNVVLQDKEIEELEKVLEQMVDGIIEFVPDESVTPKLHILLSHVFDFIKKNKTWGKTSEQAIESVHSYMNDLNTRYKSIRKKSTRWFMIAKHMIDNNFIHDTQNLKNVKD